MSGNQSTYSRLKAAKTIEHTGPRIVNVVELYNEIPNKVQSTLLLWLAAVQDLMSQSAKYGTFLWCAWTNLFCSLMSILNGLLKSMVCNVHPGIIKIMLSP